ncbi:MAG: flavin reductase family protein [Epsilonproteobacteria bacterium]|nr:flavin reductase family protein [Campylobacterota bacterium]
MIIDFNTINPTDIYKLISQSVIPRPIAWIVTEDEGIINIAPFSYFTPLSSNPPTMVISIGHKSDGTPKDTLYNLRKHKRCTICIAEPSELEALTLSAQPLDKAKSEAKAFNIETEIIDEIFPPIIKDIQTAYLCTLYQEVSLPGSKTIPLIVEINQMHIAERAIKDIEKLQLEINPIARIGKTYAEIGEELKIPKIL